MRAMVSLERLYPDKETGEPTPFTKIAAKLDPTNPSMDLLSKFVWAALVHEKDDKTPDDVLDLVSYDLKGIVYVFGQLDKAIAQGLGIDREEALAKQAEEAEAEEKKLIGANSKKSASASSE